MSNLFDPHGQVIDNRPPGQLFDAEKIGETTFDVLSVYSGHGVRYTFSHISEFWHDPFEPALFRKPKILKDIKDRLDAIKASKMAFARDIRSIHPILLEKARTRGELYKGEDEDSWYQSFLKVAPDADFQIFCGRRKAINRTDARTLAWSELRQKYSGIQI